MNFSKRAAVFVIGCVALCAGNLWLDHAAMPRQAANVSVESLNGSNTATERARAFAPIRSATDDACVVLGVVLAVACFGKPLANCLTSRCQNPSKGDCRA
jgi:hypothetical protein